MTAQKPDVLAARVRELIFSGELQPGSMLPSERKLCDFLEVGRSSVREAVTTLLEEGFLKILRGQGTRVENWSASASLEVFIFLMRRGREQGRERELLDQVLWLRRVLYRSAAPLMTLEDEARRHLEFEVLALKLDHGAAWLETDRALRSEEELLCTLAGQTGNLPVKLIAHWVRRTLDEQLLLHRPMGEVAPVQDRFKALIATLVAGRGDDAAQQLDDLCRLREPIYQAMLDEQQPGDEAPAVTP